MLIQNNKKTYLDLYGLIYGDLNASNLNITLTNNSILVVPQISKTFALSGDVARPGIYEISESENSIKSVIELNGGFSSPGDHEVVIQDVNGGILKKINDIVTNGDIIFANSNSYIKKDYVKIRGSVKREQVFLLKELPDINHLYQTIY